MAVGSIGMRLEDFCRCTPAEFRAIAEGWNDMEQNRERGEWERARMQCLCMIQPYSKEKLSPQDVMRFKWETEEGEEEVELTSKEIWERFAKVKAEQGLQ